jgi:superfamily II DNA or RNA helicase
MVKQPRFASLDDGSKRVLREAVRKYSKHLCSVENGSGHGILKLSDAHGHRRTLYTHQVIATQRLIRQARQVPWARRKASLLAIHEVGSGKTITAILTLAAVHAHNPCRDEAKTLIVVPVSVLEVWYETLQAWTTLGDRVLRAAKQAELTEAAVARARVILTTPEALVAAFKTFAHIGSAPEDLRKPRMQRFKHGVAPTDTKRLEELKGKLPPVHPLFRLLTQQPSPFGLAVVDELHRVSNPTTMAGHVVGMFTRASVYKLGLTGTPVTSKPSQIAHLAKALDAQPEWLQRQRHFFVAKDGVDRSLKRAAVAEFHQHLVDRVDASFLDLPDRKRVLLEYDPFVGLRTDGTMDARAIASHNGVLASAQRLVASAAAAAAPAPAPAAAAAAAAARALAARAAAASGAQWGEEQRAAFAAIVALGNFEFSAVLGAHGAEAFKSDPSLFEKAAAEPSQTMRLVARVIASRQEAGHARVAVFCESTTQLQILQRYLEGQGVGALYLFDGRLSAKQRGATVKRFLECEKGVLLLSSAGSIGITLCPGCEVLLSVGSLPWNAATVDQAFGRVYRIGQTRPVEIVQFVARRSVTSAKLRLHDDKRERLAKAAADEDFSNFVDGDSTWRQTQRILGACVPLDNKGNYVLAPELLAKLRAHRRLVEACDAKGAAPPAPPRGLPHPPVRADLVALPQVAFPLSNG